ncbi:TrkH family potassium uptake protein [Pseudohongiella sp. SYSU M77423]|uniref:TrkH family potassium uptake protein n=1 Tax=unclassified Pseudohongiella TaxID=2629611 RepID=UPI001F01F8CF|nr:MULTISPECIES: TrkH family potassium uptake protein [unclassified Pseudohongiella]MDH7944257.1 TrkH family potassium uptake protein [Pseudohongiella sp. SYSU M77423]
MHFAVVARILGVLLMLFSMLANLPSILVSFLYGDGEVSSFWTSAMITFATGFTLWLVTLRSKKELRTRDGFLVVTLFWTVLSTFGALPFLFSLDVRLSVTDAIFESFSGLTTTGATVITGLDVLPKSILFYRAQLQWLGGMGIVALAVAVLPMLGIGGMQLYRAESPGPVKNDNLVPRLAETAKALWYIYLGLTVTCALAYWAAGMNLFDAICHSFTTVAIGGFSNYDASIGYFDSNIVNLIAVAFMFLAGINFALHFTAWQRRSLIQYVRDPETKFYTVVLVGIALFTIIVLYATETYDMQNSFIHGLFQTVSIATTTGYTTADFNAWPYALPYLLIYASIIGACAGSTGGGMKVIRILLIFKQGIREVKRLIHPNAIISVKLGRRMVPDRVIESVWGFFAVYVMVYMALLIMLLAMGMEVLTAFSAVGASLNNLGPGLEGVAANYANISDPAKWVLCLAMLLGRLEIFTLLVLFLPMFWRR